MIIERWKAERYVASYSALVRRLGVIRDDFEHGCALARCKELVDLDPAPGTPEGAELDALASLVEAYEKARWPIGEEARS